MRSASTVQRHREQLLRALADPRRLADYALLSDCHSAALVSARGSIDWLCLPTFSSPPVFAALLDSAAAGCWSWHPAGRFSSVQSYVPGTNVLQTRFDCEHGSALLTDCLVIDDSEPRVLRPERELLRILQCVDGEVVFQMRFLPRIDYGRRPCRLHRIGELGWQCRRRGMDAILQVDFPLRACAGASALVGRVRLHRDQSAHASWSYSDREICVLPPLLHAEERRDSTTKWWQEWSRDSVRKGPYASAVQRSLLVLKALSSSLTGAVLAAPTASLPEAIGGVRNWDYRYCWIRDSAFAMRAFLELGCDDEAAAFQSWLLRAVRIPWSKLQVMYDLWGNTHLRERTIAGLSGFAGSTPVRVGNAARRQFQADLYGELIAATADFVARGGTLDRDEQDLLRRLARRVLQLWRLPDNGIWEKRSAPRHHTFSKAMCWVALEQLRRLDARLGLGLPEERLRAEQRIIRDEIEHRGYNEALQAYVGYYDGTSADASLLLLARYGYQPANHPRMLGTFALIERELTRAPFVWRYRDDDGVPGNEASFLPCAFWAVEYLALAGRLRLASERLSALMQCASPTGLLSEEYAPASRTLLGNYPQSLTHESLIAAVLALDEARRRD